MDVAVQARAKMEAALIFILLFLFTSILTADAPDFHAGSLTTVVLKEVQTIEMVDISRTNEDCGTMDADAYMKNKTELNTQQTSAGTKLCACNL